MKDRIRQIMESQHMTQQTFANFIELSPAALSSIFNDRTRPTLNIVESIKKKFPTINLEWLMFGKGQMFEKTSDADGNLEGQPSNVSVEQALDFGEVNQQVSRMGSTPNLFQGNYLSSNHLVKINAKNIDKPKRSITEIRVFFDDQTWESFIPKK